MANGMLSCLPLGATPSAGITAFGMMTIMTIAITAPMANAVAFAFFDNPTIRNISSNEGTTTYTPAFFVRHVSKPHSNNVIMIPGLDSDEPLVRIPSTNNMQKGMKNRTEIVSFANEENITGKSGNNAKNANST